MKSEGPGKLKHILPQSSQQKPKVEKEFLGTGLWLYLKKNPVKLHLRPTESQKKKKLHQQKHYQLGVNGT